MFCELSIETAVSGVHEGLKHLHDVYGYAHLDIRLPNICRKNDIVDFDRCTKFFSSDVSLLHSSSVMYKPPIYNLYHKTTTIGQ